MPEKPAPASRSEISAAASTLARLGAHTKWAKVTDRPAATLAARTAFEQKFLDEADGDPVRADHLRKAYYARLTLRSAKVRAARKAAQGGDVA